MDVKSIFGNARASIRPHGLVLRGDLFSVGQVGSGPWFDQFSIISCISSATCSASAASFGAYDGCVLWPLSTEMWEATGCRVLGITDLIDSMLIPNFSAYVFFFNSMHSPGMTGFQEAQVVVRVDDLIEWNLALRKDSWTRTPEQVEDWEL